MSDFEFDAPKNDVKEEKVVLKQENEVKTEPNAAEEPKYDSDELAQIFDNLMFEGEHQETVKVRGRNATFRTRTAEETMKISKELDSMTVNFVATLQQHRIMLNLAFALVNFNGKDLSSMEPLPDRYKLISKLPTQVIGILEEELVKFDAKVDAACKDPENF